MITQTGYVGLVPEVTATDDLVCVLYGCDTPVILRPENAHFVLIGECYIHGLMDGELVDALRFGAVSETCFEVR